MAHKVTDCLVAESLIFLFIFSGGRCRDEISPSMPHPLRPGRRRRGEEEGGGCL